MIELTQLAGDQSGLHVALDVLQLAATILLGTVAISQARAAREQAKAAKVQADAADMQAKVAHASLKQSIRPRLLPSKWEPTETGGHITLQNVGQGSAYAVRWRFDREWHWTDGEEQLANGDMTMLTVLAPIAERKIYVEYHSEDEEIFATCVNTSNLSFVYIEPRYATLIPKLRAKQQGR
jgi:hypothetical protein